MGLAAPSRPSNFFQDQLTQHAVAGQPDLLARVESLERSRRRCRWMIAALWLGLFGVCEYALVLDRMHRAEMLVLRRDAARIARRP